jgi:hypothetical protein
MCSKQARILGNKLRRKEAVALFTELVAKGYIQPNLVLIEQRKPDKYQLKIKGNYDRSQIEVFLKNTMFSIEENKNYLIIFKP